MKNNPDNLRQLNPKFPRGPRKNVCATSRNQLDSMLDHQMQEKTDEDWCELIVAQIMSVEDPSKRLQVFDAIMGKSKEFAAS